MNRLTRTTHHRPTALASRLVATAVLCAGATMGMTVVTGPASAADDDVCAALTSGKIDTPENPETVTVTLSEEEIAAGKVITGYCVKAGSENQEDGGPEYVTLDPPVTTITFEHSTKKGISHYSYTVETRTPAPKVSGTPTITDPCGPNNEVVSSAPENVIFTPADLGTVIQVTVSAAEGFTLDQEQKVFDLAVNDAACVTPPSVVTAVAPTFADLCDPDNEVLTLPVTNGVTYSPATVGNVITVTAAANPGFVLSAPASYTFTVNDAACAPTNEVAGQTGNNNAGNNNNGNNNAGNNNGGNNNPGVLGQQASNSPAAAPQAAPAAQVPTVINAGLAGEAPASPFAPAMIALFGALMGLVAFAMRGGLARVGGGKA